VTAETYAQEVKEALAAYDKYIVCLDKPPDEFRESIDRLLRKAIDAYEKRGPNLRHGIALDRYVTVILSQGESERPLCAIYFNLYSPYHKRPAKGTTATEKRAGGGQPPPPPA